MKAPLHALAAALRRYGRPKKIGIALSGGGDSVALLHAATKLREKLGFAVMAIHINHGLRPEAESEARFCKKLCTDLNSNFKRVDLNLTARGKNLHETARKARYEALEQLGRKHNLDFILTAHTLDDQAETLLQRIMRGTGPSGLSGIQERVGMFLRPWLGLRRRELREYDRVHGLTWVEDPSNQNLRYTRIKIRRQLLPLMAKIGGDKVADALGRLADSAADERAVLEEITAADFLAVQEERGLNLEGLRQLSQGRRLLVMRRWFLEKGIIPTRRTTQDIDRMIAATGPRGPYCLTKDLSVYRGYKYLNWGGPPVVLKTWKPLPAGQPVDLVLGDRLRLLVGPAGLDNGATAQRIPAKALKDCVWQPPWPGARFRPHGMKEYVKLKDFFINRKIPKDFRKIWPLLVKNGQILAIGGLRLAAGWEWPKSRGPIWEIRLEWL